MTNNDIETAKNLIGKFIRCPNDYAKILTLSEKFSLDDFVKNTCKRHSIPYQSLSEKKLTCRVFSQADFENNLLYKNLMNENGE